MLFRHARFASVASVGALAFALVALASLSGDVGVAHAQGNDLSAPIGGRTALMGNTGVALARDGAAPFLNPATIVRIQDQRLAFSVNFYSLGLTHYGNIHQPGNVDAARFGNGASGSTSETSNSFRVLPSTLCLFFTLGDLEKLVDKDATVVEERVPRRKLALCFASLESEDSGLQAVRFNNQTSAGATSQVESIQRRWSRTYIGPTYSAYLTNNLAIGGSLQGVYTYDSFGLNATSLSALNGGGSISSALGTSGSGFSLALTALVGVAYKHKDIAYGLSVRPPSFHVFGNYNATYNQSDATTSTATAANAANDATITTGHGTLHAESPMRISGGIGSEKNRLHWEVDGALDIPLSSALNASLDTQTTTSATNGVTTTNGHTTYTIPQRAVFNPSGGVEYFLRPSFSVLGGLSANLTGLSGLESRAALGNLVQARRSDIAGSFGIGSYRDGTELLFGMQLDYGWGQTIAANSYVVPNNYSVIDVQSYSAMLIVAGATDLRSIEHAVEGVQNVVKTGDPTKSK